MLPTAVATLLGCLVAGCAADPSPPGNGLHLVAIVVVDQMRADYVDRFFPLFGTGGFRRLLREGRYFTDARYVHATTLTASGHAVLGSGVYGDVSGIVGNEWYSRDRRKFVYCVDGPGGAGGACEGEDAVPSHGARGTRVENPCHLGATSLAGRVKARYAGSRVVGVSLKDRSAILATGEGADAVYWLRERGAPLEFTTSAFYPGSSREMLEAFNRGPLAAAAARLDSPWEVDPAEWLWQQDLPGSERQWCPDDLARAHEDMLGLGRDFPHRVETLAALTYAPFGNELVTLLAKEAVRHHELGRNPSGQPDVLVVGYSSLDYVGHLYGPDSCEVADTMARLDHDVDELLSFLEGAVGREGLVVFLTSDHGVSSLPEVLVERGSEAGRIDLLEGRAMAIGGLPPERQRIEQAFAEATGKTLLSETPLSEAFVLALASPNVHLNHESVPESELPRWRSWAKEQFLRVNGIAAVYTADEIETGHAPPIVRNGFRKDRSGDLVLVPAPGWVFSLEHGAGGANHGTPHDYDTHVPLFAWGGPVTAGVENGPVDIARVAPTIAWLLDLDSSGFATPQPLPLSGKGTGPFR